MRVIVVGGGIVGTCIAWRAAQAGLDVTVLDADPDAGAWRVAAGMLAPVLEATPGAEDLLRSSLASARAWPVFAADLAAAADADVGYETAGTLLVARRRDDVTELREVLAQQRAFDLSVTPITAAAAREREPHLHPGIRAAIDAPDDHRVDPRRVVAAAVTAGQRAGVRREVVRVRALATDGDRVTGVYGEDGTRVDADAVVLAAGTGSAAVAQDGGEAREASDGPPVRPVKGQLVVLRALDGVPPLSATVRGLVDGRAVYLVPRPDGRVIVGATEEERGHDRTVTAGGVRRLLDDAAALVPVVDELELVETLVGLRPATPDGRPLIGPGELDGLWLATGHHRHGVLLAPRTTELIVAGLLGTEADAGLDLAPEGPAGGRP